MYKRQVKDEERDSKGLKLLKYAIAGSKLGINCDERSTFSSILKRVEEKFMLVNTPSTPLQEFYNFRWSNSGENFARYIVKLRGYLLFLSNENSKDQLIAQHCIEQFRPEMRVLVQKKSLAEIEEAISHLSVSDVCLENSVSAIK